MKLLILVLDLVIIAAVNADTNDNQGTNRQSRGLISYMLQNGLPATLFAPISFLFAGNEAFVETIELATENHLCKRSKQIAQESDVHALTGQDPQLPFLVFCRQWLHGLKPCLEPHARYFNVTYPDGTPCPGNGVCLNGKCFERPKADNLAVIPIRDSEQEPSDIDEPTSLRMTGSNRQPRNTVN